MKLLSVLFLFSVSNLSEFVVEFHELNSRAKEEAFIAKYKSSTEASVLGYVYAIEMKQIEYSYNPVSKIKDFNTIKTKLDNLVAKFPTNVHLRYIRLVIQEKTPSILGYKNFIEADKKVLSEKLKIKDESDYLDTYIYKNTSL
jgi:hypothetical protein